MIYLIINHNYYFHLFYFSFSMDMKILVSADGAVHYFSGWP
jgi:hypothetical protein